MNLRVRHGTTSSFALIAKRDRKAFFVEAALSKHNSKTFFRPVLVGISIFFPPATNSPTETQHWEGVDMGNRLPHAFGLPEGSIRAILALLLFGTIWGLILVQPNRELPDYVRDLLFIMLGHYFAARRAPTLEQNGGPPPLYLPRGTLRLMFLAGFVTVGVVLARNGRLTSAENQPGAVTLILVGGFLIGVVVSKISAWWVGRGHSIPRYVEDVRASVALVAALLLVTLVWNHAFGFLPHPRPGLEHSIHLHIGRYGLEHVLTAIVGFYFGSRS
jgi:hypothetical protein